jgi:hypothetical protein
MDGGVRHPNGFRKAKPPMFCTEKSIVQWLNDRRHVNPNQ